MRDACNVTDANVTDANVTDARDTQVTAHERVLTHLHMLHADLMDQ